MYYHDGVGTYTNADQEAGDNSYRYSGANPNNYVCFGSSAETCPEDNLYRIIGVFDYEVKLIKLTRYGSSYMWDSENSNIWDESTKPEIYTVLSTYYNNLESEWQNKIAGHVWKLGGFSRSIALSEPLKIVFDYEVGIYQTGYEELMPVGLMYASDYGYAASPENWVTEIYFYDSSTTTNWLYIEEMVWTISKNSSVTDGIFCLYDDGKVRYDETTYYRLVLPSFYLNSNVQYISGTDTQTDPYRISE